MIPSPRSREVAFGSPAFRLDRPHAFGAGGGIPDTIVIDGITYQLLTGFDSQPLTGFDGQYLYGVHN